MKTTFLLIIFLISSVGSALDINTHSQTIMTSDLPADLAKKICIEDGNSNGICLMTRANAESYCESKELKLPSALYFMSWARALGAASLGKESCGNSRKCQLISPLNEESFYYNSNGFEDEELLNYWYHTSSLREEGANYQFDVNGYMSSSSDENPGNVICALNLF